MEICFWSFGIILRFRDLMEKYKILAIIRNTINYGIEKTMNNKKCLKQQNLFLEWYPKLSSFWVHFLDEITEMLSKRGLMAIMMYRLMQNINTKLCIERTVSPPKRRQPFSYEYRYFLRPVHQIK